MARTTVTRARVTSGILLTAMVLVWASVGQAAGEHRLDGPGMQQFRQRADEYVVLRSDLQRGLPRLDVTSDSERIQIAVDALAAAIRQARATARLGELFTPASRSEFREAIRAALDANHYAVDDLLVAMRADIPAEGERPDIGVNVSFPWAFAAATPLCVLAALPPLPKSLEYRFIARDLLLVDTDASLIIDILPDAL